MVNVSKKECKSFSVLSVKRRISQSVKMCGKKSYFGVTVWALLIIVASCGIRNVQALQWDNSVDMNDEFRLLWNIKGAEITFEVQVATLGYVGIGFSSNGAMDNADMAIGWVDQGQAYFQDRHIKKNSADGEPVVDPSQDYFLLHGYENATHTVLRFKRKLDTCDTANDVPITNDTMRVIFMYSEEEPRHGAISRGSLPRPLDSYQGYRSLYLQQRVSHEKFFKFDPKLNILELKNDDVELPKMDATLYWCKLFKFTDMPKKQHIVRFEPVFDSDLSKKYMNHIMLYECQGSTEDLEEKSRERGFNCNQQVKLKQCNAIVATWAKGSEGFTYPPEAGFPIDLNNARYYLMETHYSNMDDGIGYDPSKSQQVVDSSGLKLFYTQSLRKYDAGFLSVGIESNWRLIISPGQEHVVSEGHCIDECTKKAFPPLGIHIFGVMARTHQIGKAVRLRHVRGREELPPILRDSNTDASYQELRRLNHHVRAMPGDRFIAECTYDSSHRKAITLGGRSMNEETCLVYTMYYPRQTELTTCHSLPSLPTVLHSLGIQELEMGSNPVVISAPADLKGMSLEERLRTYDWQSQFRTFQKVTQKGSFKVHCVGAKDNPIMGTENSESYSPNLTKLWHPTRTCAAAGGAAGSNRGMFHSNRYDSNSITPEYNVMSFDVPPGANGDPTLDNEVDSRSGGGLSGGGAARSKVSRRSESLGLSSSSRISFSSLSLLVIISVAVSHCFS